MISYDRTKLDAELIRDEGLKLTLYHCPAGKLTGGVGHNFDANPLTAQQWTDLDTTMAQVVAHELSQPQAMQILDWDISNCERNLDDKLPWWRKLDGVRQRVLLNMCFNLGIGSLCGFKNTLALIQAGKYAAAAQGMIASKWAAQVGQRAVRLAHMIAYGEAA